MQIDKCVELEDPWDNWHNCHRSLGGCLEHLPWSWEPALAMPQTYLPCCHCFHVVTEHMGPLSCLWRLHQHGSTDWPFPGISFFWCHIGFPNSHAVSRLSLAWKCWQLLHDGKANASLPPCSPPTCDSHGFLLRESIKTLRTKDFFQHFGGLFFLVLRTIRITNFVAGDIPAL